MKKILLAVGLTFILTSLLFLSIAAANPTTLPSIGQQLSDVLNYIGDYGSGGNIKADLTSVKSDTTSIKDDTTSIKGDLTALNGSVGSDASGVTVQSKLDSIASSVGAKLIIVGDDNFIHLNGTSANPETHKVTFEYPEVRHVSLTIAKYGNYDHTQVQVISHITSLEGSGGIVIFDAHNSEGHDFVEFDTRKWDITVYDASDEDADWGGCSYAYTVTYME
jgi:hypothetical protein